MRHFIWVYIPIVHTAFIGTKFFLFLVRSMCENSAAVQANIGCLFSLKIGFYSISGNVKFFRNIGD
ncbi:MAG: hypothetical protein K2J44_06770 [Ruminococcus sp.]|nr:hypothetical protein [Ruminococcus sp.]